MSLETRGAVAGMLVLALAACGSSGGSQSPAPPPAVNGPPWLGFAKDAQHSAQGATAAQGGVGALALNRIAWSTSVDLSPPTANQIHYGSPLISAHNTVLVPVKTTAAGGFGVQVQRGYDGAMMWSAPSDYVLPPLANGAWIPSFGPTLTAMNSVYMPGAGGRVLFVDAIDTGSGALQSVVFYGAGVYAAAPATFNATVFIDTPITADAAGNLYFGFRVSGANPGNLASGFARIGADRNCPVNCTWVAASAALGSLVSSDPVTSAMNAAPAVSLDGTLVYVVASTLPATGNPTAYLLALDSLTLANVGGTALIDPNLVTPAWVDDSASATPLVGPDGDVYYGVLEAGVNPADLTTFSHNDRGWLLHFDRALMTSKTPGSFGWDNTPSIVPANIVTGYTGTSSYLLLSKYNNYADFPGGDGKNRMAILDPFQTEADPVIPGVTVMKEVITLLGQTPDPDWDTTKPGAVKEWCVNTAAVDPVTRSALINSEDGYLYRWDLSTGAISQKIQLNAGIPQAYTPTALGPDGAVYAINGAQLQAIRN